MIENTLVFYIALAFAGAFGACARYGLDRLVKLYVKSAFPTGILLVNLSGALLVGLLAGLAVSGWPGSQTVTIIAVGFAGAYTTFSGWMVQTVELLESGNVRTAMANLMLSMLPGWLLTLGGFGLGLLMAG